MPDLGIDCRKPTYILAIIGILLRVAIAFAEHDSLFVSVNAEQPEVFVRVGIGMAVAVLGTLFEEQADVIRID